MSLQTLAAKYDQADAILLQQAPAAGQLATLPQQPQPQQAANASFDFVGTCAPALVIACKFIAKRYGEHWQTDIDEARELMTAYDRLMPDDWQMSPGGAALVATGAFVGPRLMLSAIEKAKKKEQPQGKPQGNPGGVVTKPDHQEKKTVTNKPQGKPATVPQSSRGK